MAYTFVLPCRSVSHGLTDLYFNDEQVDIMGHQSEYDADVETTDIEEDEAPQYEANKKTTATTQATNPLIITWKALKTAQSGISGVNVAQVDILAQADILQDGNWHAVHTSQIEPIRTNLPRFGGWTPINNPPSNSSPVDFTQVETSETDNTQCSAVHLSDWSVTSGSQTDTSQATSVEPAKPSSYPQIWKTSHLHSSNTTIHAKTTMADMPQLKIYFRRYKKEYTSTAAQDQIKWFRYRIACLNTGKKSVANTEMADIKLQWGRLLERRRWLKQEMTRIKHIYTMAKRRHQERLKYELRASYDIGFIKSLRKD
ncbi:uncharacterized protein EAF01_005626 [Botrytis porri]|uniref:Uncharacterized protein n=1 Tax=Botrytis porri TaxID=87229 RepID=A0A4Z1L562_9HELO|nr:uncharacterized protein EAF01_005626 [Botrytis porri]KAF7905105.1 hypothetical protein EAF01_005626 [Botrytis porri]TGO91919.1 hypothetical protein BPOR_0015g00290 [Botrytis porri]